MSARIWTGIVAHGCVALSLLGVVSFRPAIAAQSSTSSSETTAPATAPAHPLDPLTAEEIEQTSRLLSQHPDFPRTARFPLVALNEPPKWEVVSFAPGHTVRRESYAVVYDPVANRTYEAVVDLVAGRVLRWERRPGVQPVVLFEEYEKSQQIAKADPRFRAALQRRGIVDVDRVMIEFWAGGTFLPKGHGHARLMRGVCYLRDGAANYYGRPIEGLIPTVDINAGKLVHLIDTGPVPIAPETQELDPAALGTPRHGLKALHVAQPDGPSFEVNGQEVHWQNWRFRFSMHARDGLVLHQVRYEDDGRPRSILYRASVSETVVPYGDPDPAWSWRAAFDQGHYGFGVSTFPLVPGRDAPEGAVLFDFVLADDQGQPTVRKNAVALYERDGGTIWRHADDKGIAQARRGRELVILYATTLGNYDYVFSWIFRQDGSLEADVGATGIMLAKGVAEQTAAGHSHGSRGLRYAHLVAPGIAAPHHQHFINYRLDFDVDGERNSVSELNAWPVGANRGNPVLNAFQMTDRALTHEVARDLNPQSARKWRIWNPSVTTRLGYHPGYYLVPGENSRPMILPGNRARRQAGFIDHAFWVTRFRADELYAAGPFPNQSRQPGGLPSYVAGRERVNDSDLVVWYTMGLTHMSRPEEWPVMPMAHIGFKLLPAAFFDRNPALDVP